MDVMQIASLAPKPFLSAPDTQHKKYPYLLRNVVINRVNQPIYQWKKKYGGMDVSQLRKLKELEDENSRLKHMYADLALDNHIHNERPHDALGGIPPMKYRLAKKKD